MRKNSILLFMCMCIIVSACGKKDDPAPANNPDTVDNGGNGEDNGTKNVNQKKAVSLIRQLVGGSKQDNPDGESLLLKRNHKDGEPEEEEFEDEEGLQNKTSIIDLIELLKYAKSDEFEFECGKEHENTDEFADAFEDPSTGNAFSFSHKFDIIERVTCNDAKEASVMEASIQGTGDSKHSNEFFESVSTNSTDASLNIENVDGDKDFVINTSEAVSFNDDFTDKEDAEGTYSFSMSSKVEYKELTISKEDYKVTGGEGTISITLKEGDTEETFEGELIFTENGEIELKIGDEVVALDL